VVVRPVKGSGRRWAMHTALVGSVLRERGLLREAVRARRPIEHRGGARRDLQTVGQVERGVCDG
jgi:hypothetical protein